MKYPGLFFSFLLIAFSYAVPAYAYLDPGTGSMILQLALGGIAGVLVVGKLYWYRLKSLFSGKSGEAISAREVNDDG